MPPSPQGEGLGVRSNSKQTMKKIFLTIAVFIFSAALLQAQTDTMYVMKAGVVINKQCIKLANVDSIIFYKPVIVTPGSSIQTALITGGMFIMGSPTSEVSRQTNETQFAVTLSSFRMSKYEITNTQYAAFLNAKSIGSNGIWAAAPLYKTQALIYTSSGSYDWGLHYSGSQWIPVTGYETSPVINVTWYGSAEFATYVGGTLPTEAQWEYACRAGTTTPFNTGSCLTNSDANYYWSSPYNTCVNTVTTPLSKTQPVGSYAPNAYGLYDMHGNVWEWCADWYGTYPTSAQTNPTGAATGSYRVRRGGCWNNLAQHCRSAFRTYNDPDGSGSSIGFRVVFVP